MLSSLSLRSYSSTWTRERLAMANPLRGEVWLVDLGMVAKIRPCLVFSVPAAGPNDRVLVTVVAHTTSARGSGFEVAIPARFLKPGVFDVQNIISIPHAKLVRRLGVLTSDQMAAVATVVCKWLGL
jgi:mRNA interferase MazF